MKKQESLQIERFTMDTVIPTKTLQQMNKPQLIKEIERLERHAIQLDQGLTLVLENLYSVKKKQAEIDNSRALNTPDEESVAHIDKDA